VYASYNLLLRLVSANRLCVCRRHVRFGIDAALEQLVELGMETGFAHAAARQQNSNEGIEMTQIEDEPMAIRNRR